MVWERSEWLFAFLLGANALCAISWAWLWRKAKNLPEKASQFARILTATLLVITIGLGTLPSSPPFQPNIALGTGLLAGSLGISLSFWLAEVKGKAWFSCVGIFLPFAVPLLVQKGNPLPSLFGLFIANAVTWFCLGEIWQNQALMTISLSAAIGLARLHGAPMAVSKQLWQTIPIIFAFAGWLGSGLIESWQRYWQKNVKGIGSLLILSATLLLGAIVASYWTSDWRFLGLTLLICFAALITREAEMTDFRDLTVIIWIGLFVFAFATFPNADRFRLLGGYGAAIAAVGLTWLAVIQSNDCPRLMQGAILTTAFSLFRLFAEIYPLRAPRADLYTHYTFVGFLLGVTVPVLLMRWMERERRLARDFEVGFWSAATPLVLGAVWGIKAVAGYLAGGIAAVLLISPFNHPTLFAGFATALPLTALVEPASDLPRKIRAWISVGAVIAFILTLLVDVFVQRRREGLRGG